MTSMSDRCERSAKDLRVGLTRLPGFPLSSWRDDPADFRGSVWLLPANTRSRRAQRNLVFGIHVENADCRPADGGLSDQVNSAPPKMVVPIFPPGME
jgi:hypothetical protein